MSDFVHLHTHSHYTLLESPVTVKTLLNAAYERNMSAVALTDRANLFAALEFQVTAAGMAKEGKEIQSIVGCQINMAPLGMTEKTRDMHQLVLLAMSEKGYYNLTKLVSLGWLNGFYYEARVDIDCLREHAEGLICLTGAGPYGYLNYHFESGAVEEARRLAGNLAEIFDDNRLFVEITDHGLENSKDTLQANVDLARDLDLPLVATNWVHYLNHEDAYVHDVQLAVQKVTTLNDTRRKRMPPGGQFYLKTAEEMEALFVDYPEAISNTKVIADRCKDCHIITGVYHLPVFDCPDSVNIEAYKNSFDEREYQLRYEVDAVDGGEDKPKSINDAERENRIHADAYLSELCEEGMRNRYENITPELRERLDFEICTIARMGFGAYFLIVADFINWAKEQDIPVGPGRGSAAGSLVAYSLGITDICPIKYGLLFERFLNPGRISMPDIDIDFCKDRREEVIQYVKEKYGSEAVVNIMTLGTMKARMAIKDVARAYEWTPDEAQTLASMIPEDPSGKHTIPVCLGLKPLKGDAFDKQDKISARYESDERSHDVLDTAMALEGLGRSLGVHACGVIIAPSAVQNYLPVCQVKGKPATQYNMMQCEDCGLLKMDFLGLKTMSILKKAADIVKATTGEVLDYNTVPIDDAKTFSTLGEGQTLGVFQCESQGFQELIKLLKPDRFEDLIALVALYRPGPLSAGMHTSYCDRKHGREKVEYPHPVLEEVLKETYGLYIYQEQVMNISRSLCGFSQSEADNLRKAMGKKQIAVLQKMQDKFINGAWELHQFDRDKCERMWNDILGFAAYCFNKSHSACYGLIAYWTAYMKANHFEAFMTANLIYEMGNKDKMTLFTQELADRGVSVLPPDINESGWEFTWTGKAVRFGFGGIKGVGHLAAEHLIQEREAGEPFDSLYNICERIDTRQVNKRVIENMIKVGAMSSLHSNRNALVETIERAFQRSQRLAKTASQSQNTLFSVFEEDDSFMQQTQGYVEVEDWSEGERLRFEKELTGYWMSGHPLLEHKHFLEQFATHVSRDLADMPPDDVSIAAVIIAKRDIKTRTGKMMAVLTVEDDVGRFDVVLFGGRTDRRGVFIPGAYEKFAGECEPDMVALFTGKVDTRSRPAPRPAAQASAGEEEDGEASLDVDEDHVEQLPSLLVDDVTPVHLIHERRTEAIEVTIDIEKFSTEQLTELSETMSEYMGSCPVTLLIQTPNDVLLSTRVSKSWNVHPTPDLVDALSNICGSAYVRRVLKQK